MLTREENELLTQVGPGTPMGELFRRYWLPALLAEELPSPDCDPVRVRLLGEDLVAFRDSDGRVGLLEEYCAHRRASLYYGRSEECGLRCIYHGWKYDVTGAILDTPAEPADSMIRHHVRQPAYPCREVNGLIYTYLGPPEKMPLFPRYEWLTLPPDHVGAAKYINECNYLQAMEGDIDNSHTRILHRRLNGTPRPMPSFDVEPTPWGITVAALNPEPDDQVRVHTNTFIMPSFSCNVPPATTTPRDAAGRPDGFFIIYQIPADDVTTIRYNLHMRRTKPVTHAELAGDWRQGGPDYRKVANRTNNYLIDRKNSAYYSGIDLGIMTQDACVTESMGAICDRTREHIGYGDTQIVAVRQLLLQSARDAQQGRDPPGVYYDPAADLTGSVTTVDTIIPRNASWRDLLPAI